MLFTLIFQAFYFICHETGANLRRKHFIKSKPETNLTIPATVVAFINFKLLNSKVFHSPAKAV